MSVNAKAVIIKLKINNDFAENIHVMSFGRRLRRKEFGIVILIVDVRRFLRRMSVFAGSVLIKIKRNMLRNLKPFEPKLLTASNA